MVAACLLLASAACQKEDPPKTAKLAPPMAKHPLYRIIETPPESDYEAALDHALRVSMTPDALQQICSQWYPAFGRDVAEAYVDWRKQNQPTIDELRRRSTEVWSRRAGPDDKYVVMVYPHIRKEVIDTTMRRSDSLSVREFESACKDYPRETSKPEWRLERRLNAELKVIRARAPLEAPEPPRR